MEFKLKPPTTMPAQPAQPQKSNTPAPVLKPLASTPKSGAGSGPATTPKASPWQTATPTKPPVAPTQVKLTAPAVTPVSISKFGPAKATNAQTPTATPKASPWHPATPKSPLTADAAKTTGNTPASAGAKAPQTQATTPKLTNQQLKDAKAWYAQRKDQYTPEVLKQIQEKLGIKQTGTVDTATLQAIAKWEAKNKPLPMDGIQGKFAIDGKADVTLLEHLFPSKYISPEAVAAYTKDFKALEGKWASLTPQQRVEALERIINRQLDRVGVPEVQVISNPSIGSATGLFLRTNWQISVQPKVVNADELVDPGALANTLFHEGEHARQFFDIGRLSPELFHDPLQSLEKFMPREYLKDAIGKGLKTGSVEGIKARAYWLDANDMGRVDDMKALNDAKFIRDNIVEKYNRAELTVTPDMQKYFEALNNATTDAERRRYKALFERAAEPVRLELERLAKLRQQAEADVDSAWFKYASHPLESDAWRAGGIVSRNYDK